MTTYSNYLALKRDHHLKAEEIRKLSSLEGLIDFSSNDYLGFARSQTLLERFCHSMQSATQLGSTGSRLLTGNSKLCEKIERQIASYHQEEAALLFPSGYMANLGLMSAVLTRDEYVFYDERVHASIRDGITLSRARSLCFKHNEIEHLETLLKRASKPPFVIIESIYSTDGALAPLAEIISLCQKFEAKLIVDEAHATGVFGPGLVKQKVFARVHTFGKALGVQGAAIIGSSELRDYLITRCRPFIYTTAPSFPFLIAIECAYQLLKQNPPNLLAFCKTFGLSTPIHAIKSKEAKKLAQRGQRAGFDIRALLYPTVPRGEECLRICLHTFNTKEEVNQLYEWLDCHGD